MNDIRRKAIEITVARFRTRLEGLCEEYAQQLKMYADKEREEYEKLSDSSKLSEIGIEMEDCARSLETAYTTLYDFECFDELAEVFKLDAVGISCKANVY